MARQTRGEPPGNYVSEWFGHRVYPLVVSTPEAIADQRSERCPFLSQATGEARRCIKSEASKGICTISSASNRARQDWLVCPYRALDPELVGNAVRRLFGLPSSSAPRMLPAVNLQKLEERADIGRRLGAGELVFIYFDARLGGELSIPPTARSPEFSFDMTVIELVERAGVPHVGRFGFLEIQTMDSTALIGRRCAICANAFGCTPTTSSAGPCTSISSGSPKAWKGRTSQMSSSGPSTR